MLHCRGGYFYTGHTEDLDRRMAEHRSGLIPGFSADHQPVELVWSEVFQSRDEAKAMERRIKGWSRAKKLALIRGDWAAISDLARGQIEEGTASTGSAKPGFTRDALFLHPHPAQCPAEPLSLGASVQIEGSNLTCRFRLTGDLSFVRVPPLAPSSRCDGLWQRMCFEAFVMAADGYLEFNFSPSTEWAAYKFFGYREGMRDLEIEAPNVRVQQGRYAFELAARISLPIDIRATHIGLSAVVEELDGTKSYWALRHPPGDKPDFHHPDCFALELPPATGS